MVKLSRSYGGELATPIVPEIILGFEGRVTRAKAKKRENAVRRRELRIARQIEKIRREKLALLMKHYGIDGERAWRSLALRLAIEHVPGFQVFKTKPRRGAPVIWDCDRLLRLLTTVREVQKRSNLSEKAACRVLATKDEFKREWGTPYGRSERSWIESLEFRLNDAKRFERRIAESERALQKAAASVASRRRGLSRQKVFR